MHRKESEIHKEPFFAQSDEIYHKNQLLFEKKERTEEELKTTHNLLLSRINFLEKSKQFFSATSSSKFGQAYFNISHINKALANIFYDLAGIFYDKISFAPDREAKINLLLERLHFLEKSLELYSIKDDIEVVIKEIAESNESVGDLYVDENQLHFAKKAYTRAITYLTKSALPREESEVEWQIDIYISLLEVKYNLKEETVLEKNHQLRLKNLIDSLSTPIKSKKLLEFNGYVVKPQPTSVAKIKKVIAPILSASKKRKQPEISPVEKIPQTEEKPSPKNTSSSTGRYHLLDCLLHITQLRGVGSALDTKTMKPSKDIDGIRLVHVNSQIEIPSKIIAYEMDNVIFDKSASFETLAYQFICMEKIKEVAKYARENNILLVVLTHRAESDYFYNRSPFSCHEIANEIFGLNHVNYLIYTSDLPGGKGKACQILWDQYFSHLSDGEKFNRICMIDCLHEDISSVKKAGFHTIQMKPTQELQNHQEVLTFARSIIPSKAYESINHRR
jgi:tetratricopeptide (TPR) repeat protein